MFRGRCCAPELGPAAWVVRDKVWYEGGFRAIQLRVLNGPVRFLRVVVHYGNGADQELSLRALIPAGGTTRAIDLPGDRRIIRSVEFWYSKANWGAPACRPSPCTDEADANERARPSGPCPFESVRPARRRFRLPD